MTTLNEAKEAVYQRFVDNFTGVTPDRITFDNEAFDPPDTGDWVRVSVRGVGRGQSTLGKKGNRKFRSKARLFVQVFTQADTGVKQAGVLATEATDIYEGESFSGLDFTAVNTRESGPDKKWYMTVVEAPFDYDEIK